MKKSDLKDGDIVEIKWTNLGFERYIKLGEDLVGPTGNVKLYALENDLTINQGLNNVSKVTKVFKNKNMTFLKDIENDDRLTLIWERQREIDWSKVPTGTKVLVGDSTSYMEPMIFVGYLPFLTRYPFLAVGNYNEDVASYSQCRIHESVEIKNEWYK